MSLSFELKTATVGGRNYAEDIIVAAESENE